MITHDLGVVAQTCDKVAIMYAGEIVEYGTAEDVFNGKINIRIQRDCLVQFLILRRKHTDCRQ